MKVVVAGIIERDGLILVGQRRANDSHPLKWEFPGGKVEEGESPEQALSRELREELGIEASIGTEIARHGFAYPGKPPIELIFYSVGEFTGEPANLAFERIVWQAPELLIDLDFLEADIELIGALHQLSVRNGAAGRPAVL